VTVLSHVPRAVDPSAVPSRAAGRSADGTVRRSALASFLRACRARVTPEAVGLPPGPRRRTPGLRREEVAQLAGVGITWYTWLEQGRRINASEQVVEAIARTLKLDVAERDHLFRLAEIAPVAKGPISVLPDEIQGILDALDPLPANVTNSRFDLLAWNPAYAKLFPGIVQSGEAGKRANSLWCAFAFADCCNPFVNRDQVLPQLVAMLRSEYGKHMGEPDWETFLAELHAVSPNFTALWAQQHVAAPAAVEKDYWHATVGEIRMLTTSLYLTAVPDARIIVYSPRDEESRERVAWIRENPDAPAFDHDHREHR
jgi:transcriptional regulator with XRE-family HTH domain